MGGLEPASVVPPIAFSEPLLPRDVSYLERQMLKLHFGNTEDIT